MKYSIKKILIHTGKGRRVEPERRGKSKVE
jgi:hypothetical protein